MMKKTTAFTRILAILLCLMMATVLFASCGGKTNPPTEPTGTTAGGDATQAPGNSGDDGKVEVDYRTLLPEGTFDWEKLTVLCMDSREEQLAYDDAENANAFQKAIIARNAFMEEKYEIEFDFVAKAGGMETFNAEVTKDALAGTATFDIVMPDYYYKLETSGYFVNLCEYDNILNFENDYWVSGWNDKVIISNTMFSAVGFLNNDILSSCEVVFCNEYVAMDLGIQGQVYDAVKNKTWTLETMMSLMEMNSNDTEGDGWGPEDVYGLTYNLWSGRALLAGCGLKLVTMEDGEISFLITSENNINVFNKVKTFLTGTNYSYYGGGAGVYDTHERGERWIFGGSRALFNVNNFGTANFWNVNMQLNADAYAMYPLPMLDSTQADYITPIMGTAVQMILKNADNIEMSAKIMEAWNILSYLDTRPAYYDQMLKSKYSATPKVAEMVDLIVSKLDISFEFINSAHFGYIADAPFDLIDPNNAAGAAGKGFASHMGPYSQAMDKYLTDYLKAYGVGVSND